MQEKYGKDNMPRFDDADIAEVMKPIRDVLMTDKTTFGQLVDRVVSPLLLAPISEMNTEVWTWDRFVCCGDSVVKFMPQVRLPHNCVSMFRLLTSTRLAKEQIKPWSPQQHWQTVSIKCFDIMQVPSLHWMPSGKHCENIRMPGSKGLMQSGTSRAWSLE